MKLYTRTPATSTHRAAFVRALPLVLAALVIAGCGLGDTAASGAAGDAAGGEARQAKTPQARVKEQLDEAAHTDEQQRAAAERENE